MSKRGIVCLSSLPSMLVISDNKKGLIPLRGSTKSLVHLLEKGFTFGDVSWRMVIILLDTVENAEVRWVKERDGG